MKIQRNAGSYTEVEEMVHAMLKVGCTKISIASQAKDPKVRNRWLLVGTDGPVSIPAPRPRDPVTGAFTTKGTEA